MTIESWLKDRLTTVRPIPASMRLHARNTLRLRLRAVPHFKYFEEYRFAPTQPKGLASGLMFILVGLDCGRLSLLVKESAKKWNYSNTWPLDSPRR
ncbi:hypothetical protein E6A55_32565 (plasmid) [Cupriavidus necator H16]|uniref:Uncharacterized protein n=1 Tax=Cupriavidus necator (strain ATCC 17699 / DSM 428 / KCTC 22496 / NCIMB 10442 / H16 / Stanier 337) TaxID=381666 RepID=A0AAE5ZP43_CUPNH|nr:hypothetical protein [Cupriavidus necator]QCC05345.1 hypothetical protein E6A55_32565 [Cupriavidus necator H16]QQB81516.1 hypothetical protein I6H87_32560 [Cupriavidus necator]